MKQGAVYGGLKGYALRVMDASIFITHTPSLGIYERRQSLFNIYSILYGKWGAGPQGKNIAEIGAKLREVSGVIEPVDEIWALEAKNDFILKMDEIQADIECVIAELGILDNATMREMDVPE